MAKAKAKFDEAKAESITALLDDGDERVLVHMQKLHHHGVLGLLQEGEVYRGPKKHFHQIDNDFPDKLKFVTEDQAQKILAGNRERAEKAIDSAKRKQAARERRASERAGTAKEL